jgi:predicted permease
VWYSRWFDAAAALGREMRVGLRSLLRAKGLAATVVITLALGIGANAAIFSVVRGVLLRPLVNRGEDRLIYIRQSSPGMGQQNTTMSVPEIEDLKARSTNIADFGDFSQIGFNVDFAGEPRIVSAGVVNGSFFEVMGLRPLLGRLVGPADDGEKAAPVLVLTHRFWASAFNSDPGVVGRALSLGERQATIIGVLEPSVPYPVETEVIGNMVTSPHHMGAAMNTDRTHRMTELFGRLKPGATVEGARAELIAGHAAMVREHPDIYSAAADMRLSVTPLREQITAPARPILLVLLAAAGVVFIIACSNVANLILARSVRREGELAVRAALGASRGALRRTLLAESLVLCGAGAVIGVLLSRPLVAVVAQFASRFSIRALDVTVDSTVLWVGAALAMAAAVLLAYVPKLPASNAAPGIGLAGGNIRITPGTNRRLRAFATTQIAFSFVLLAAAGMLVATLIALQQASNGYDTRQVLAFNLDGNWNGDEISRRVRELPGVESAAVGSFLPWRDKGKWTSYQFAVEGYTPAQGEDSPFARARYVGRDFFATLGIPLLAGREFNDADRKDSEPVVIISESIARRMFANADGLNRKLWLTEKRYEFRMSNGNQVARIVGIVADADDENIERTAAMTLYYPNKQRMYAGRLFVRTAGDPYALVPPVRRIIREVSPKVAVTNSATLEDVRAEVMTPDRLNAFVVTGFAVIALLVAVVGVAGVLAFSVSARMREFGVRLAIGSAPRHLLLRVLSEGGSIVAIGIVAGAAGGYALAAVAASYVANIQLPGVLPVLAAAVVLGIAAVAASLLPAARAARVDVLQALRSE